MQNENKAMLLKKIQRKLFLLGVFKIPMIGYVNPRLTHIDDHKVQVKIRIRRRTKNHLNSMYMGVLVVGADIAAGIHAFYFSELMQKPVSFAFKGMQGDFIKRAETDIVFECTDGELIQKAMEQSADSGERINQPVRVVAYNVAGEEVAVFNMIVSVKVKS